MYTLEQNRKLLVLKECVINLEAVPKEVMPIYTASSL